MHGIQQLRFVGVVCRDELLGPLRSGPDLRRFGLLPKRNLQLSGGIEPLPVRRHAIGFRARKLQAADELQHAFDDFASGRVELTLTPFVTSPFWPITLVEEKK
jgi:hypothetical protein